MLSVVGKIKPKDIKIVASSKISHSSLRAFTARGQPARFGPTATLTKEGINKLKKETGAQRSHYLGSYKLTATSTNTLRVSGFKRRSPLL